MATELKSRRAALALSQEELAYRASLNRTFVGKLEVAQTQPSMTVIFQLAAALEIDVVEFVALIAQRAKLEQEISAPN